MKNFFKKNWALFLIIILAAFLRFYHLGSMPPSLHWDETAIGYNAYSILKTGKDEYGKFMPLVFKSFGDYKPGFYIYLTVPSVAIFGLTEFAVRFPSALIGVLTIGLIYFLSLSFFNKKRLALFTSLVLAISPWHLQFSRGAWEANVALFLVLLGIYSFVRTQKKEIKWLYFSALSFGLALLTYQSAKMFVPLIILVLLLVFYQKVRQLIKTVKKDLFLSALIFFIISLPIFLSVFTGSGGRLKVMSIFSYPRTDQEKAEILKQDNGNHLVFTLFHNETLALKRGIMERYFNHFSGKFLFFEGDWSSERHSPPYVGMLYYLDLVFILLGFCWLIRKNDKASHFIWLWLLLSPLPSALSQDSIQATRSLNMVLPLTFIIGAGFYQFYEYLRSLKGIKVWFLILIIGIGYLWCFTYYLDQYYIHYPQKSSQYWQYGYKELVNKIYPIKDNYQSIIFTQKWGQPYIYWLFYTKYDPFKYQQEIRLKESQFGDVGSVGKLDNIEFRSVFYPADSNLEKALLIGDDLELPLNIVDTEKTAILNEIIFLNGNLAFRVLATP